MRRCDVCNSNQQEFLYKIEMQLPIDHPLYNAAKEFEIVRCKECGFCYANISANQLDYDRYYGEYNNYTEVTSKKEESDQVTQDVLDLILTNTNVSSYILDMGSGCGKLLLELKKHSYVNLYGVDTTEDNLKILKEAGIAAKKGSVYNITDLTEKFDLICMSAVLEHLLFPQVAVKNLLEYMKPEGLIIVTVPNVLNFSKLSLNITHHFNYEHINYFSLESLDNLFKINGMDRISIKETNFQSDVEDLITVVYKRMNALLETELITDLHSGRAITQMLSLNNEMEVIRKEKIEDLIREDKDVIMWGIGAKCYEFLNKYPSIIKHIVALVDTGEKKQGQCIQLNSSEILEIVSPKKLSEMSVKGTILICVSALKYQDDILHTIKSLGIENEVKIL